MVAEDRVNWPVHRHTGSPRLTGPLIKRVASRCNEMAGMITLHKRLAEANKGERRTILRPDSNRQPPAFQAGALPLSYIPGKWCPRQESHLRPLASQTNALSN